MGKVAVVKLLRIIVISLSVLLALITLAGVLAPYCDPNKYKIMPFISLILPVLIVGSFIVGIYWLIRKRWTVGGIMFLSVIANANNIRAVYQLPINRGENTISITDTTLLRVMTYNVAEFSYGSTHSSFSEITSFIENSNIDIACFQEYVDTKNDGLSNDFSFMPYKAVVDRDSVGRLQTAIFSKHPILKSEQILFENSNNTALLADVLVKGKTIRILSFHMQTTNLNKIRKKRKLLTKVTSNEGSNEVYRIAQQTRVNYKKRSDQASVVRTIVDETTYPIILCGDMNEPPYSYVYKNTKGNLNDGFITCGKNYGYTFNGFFNLLRIDYIFYSNQFDGIAYHSPHLSFSDHNPVIMELKFR